MKKAFTIKEISECLKVNESMTRKLLNDSGLSINELSENPGEMVKREAVIDLYAYRAGTREGRLLSKMLRVTSTQAGK